MFGLVILGLIGSGVWLIGRKASYPILPSGVYPLHSEGQSVPANASRHDLAAVSSPPALDLSNIAVSPEMNAEFTHGYILLGLQNRKVLYQAHLKDLQLSADWDNAVLSFSTEGNWGYVYLPRLAISNARTNGKLEPVDAGQHFPLEYPESYRWNIAPAPGIPCAFLKVLNQENKILLVGFKSCP